jgi:hypothetical protein
VRKATADAQRLLAVITGLAVKTNWGDWSCHALRAPEWTRPFVRSENVDGIVDTLRGIIEKTGS